MLEETELLVVGCGPAGGVAAREAARAGVETLVLEKDAQIGVKRVCAAGLRPGFCTTFDLPKTIVHCDTPRLALFDIHGREHEVFFGPGHTTTREELDGTIAQLARAEGAQIRTGALLRSFARDGDRVVVEYADLAAGLRRRVSARTVFFAQGATARLEDGSPFAYEGWRDGLMATLQYRVYPERPAAAIAYQTLELHYYRARDGRILIGWMFPKRDHLAVGLGVMGKMPGAQLRTELDAFEARVRARLYPQIPTRRKEEGHLLYGGMPRPAVAQAGALVGGTAAGLVDATNGEGIYEAAASGRLAAQTAASAGLRSGEAARRYASALQARFSTRLRRRVRIMEFLCARPERFGMLFESLAASPPFAQALYREDRERTPADRLALYAAAARFALRALYA
ncbi:MAG: NAD(P)-binding protein [Vulcanimicrobiaceae bacterium]